MYTFLLEYIYTNTNIIPKPFLLTWLNCSNIFWLWARYGVMNLEVSTLTFFLTFLVGKPD